MSVNNTCAISSSISFLISAAIWVHMETPLARILSSRLPRVEREAAPRKIAPHRNGVLPISIQSVYSSPTTAPPAPPPQHPLPQPQLRARLPPPTPRAFHASETPGSLRHP